MKSANIKAGWICLGCVLSAFLLLSGASWSGTNGDESAESICLKAQKLYESGKVGLAILQWERALMINPENHQAFRGRGLSYLRMGRIERAISDFDKAGEELGPYREEKFPGWSGYLDWSKAHDIYTEANSLLQAGSYQEAIVKYTQALSIYPPYPQCLHNLAIALDKTGEHDAAAQRCIEAISYRDGDWKFWKTLSLELYAQGKYLFALKAMEHARELNPPVPEEVEIIESLDKIRSSLR